MSGAPPHQKRLLLRPEDAAQALSVSRTTLYGLLQSNAVRSVKVGGMRRIPVEALEEYVRHLSGDKGADRAAPGTNGTDQDGPDARPGHRSVPTRPDGPADQGRIEMAP